MSFLQPWMLLALPALFLPVVIHLLNRRRHEIVDWGAMQFLLKATREARGHARLRHFFILAMRCLAVAGLIFAASRPLSRASRAFFADRPDTVLVILDRSPSMAVEDLESGLSKRQAALRQVSSAIETTGEPAHLILLESAHGEPRRVASAEELESLPEAGATDAAADLPGLLATALDYLVANRSGRAEIWVCSDLQRSDWNDRSGQWAAIRAGFAGLAPTPRFHLLSYVERPEGNLGVRVTSIARESRGDEAWLSIDLEIRAEPGPGAGPRVVPVTFVVDGARSVVEAELAGDTLRLEGQRLPLDSNRSRGHGKVELPGDAWPRDNAFYFAYARARPPRTLVVSEMPRELRALGLAAKPFREEASQRRGADASEDSVEYRRPEELNLVDWDGLALLVWQAALPGGAVAESIERFVDSGGVVLVLPPQAAAASSDAVSLSGLAWNDWERAPPERPFVPENWVDESDLLKKGASGRVLPLGALEVRRVRRIAGEGRVLARLAGGRSLLVRARRAEAARSAGALYFLAALPHEPESNLARQGVVLYALVQRALARGSARLERARLLAAGRHDGREVGEPSEVDGASTEGSSGRAPASGSDEPLAWSRLAGFEEGALSRERPYVAGVYEIGDRLVATNRPESEDLAGFLVREDLDVLFEGLEVEHVRGELGESAPLVSEIWRLFLVAMVLALLIEAWLCLPPPLRSRRRARPSRAARAGFAEGAP